VAGLLQAGRLLYLVQVCCRELLDLFNNLERESSRAPGQAERGIVRVPELKYFPTLADAQQMSSDL
jgi:hypothetical protein